MNKKSVLWMMTLLLCLFVSSAYEISISDYDPTPAKAGDYVNVWIKVANPTNTVVEDVDVTVYPKDGLVLSQGEQATKRIVSIQPRDYDTLKYRFEVLSNSIEGPNMIEVHASQQNSYQEEELSIEVLDKDIKEIKLEVGDIESDPVRIKPDDENVRLQVLLHNLGDGKAQAVRAEITHLPEGITLTESYSGTSLLGTIAADSDAEATFYVDVDKYITPQEYQAQLNVSYKYKPDEEEEEYLLEEVLLPFNIPIQKIPLYSIESVTFDQGELQAGMKKVKMLLTLRNIGEEEGESVRVKVYGKTEQPFTFDVTSDFVAPSLAPQETGQATLEFDIDEEANLQTYQLDLELKSVYADDVILQQETVPVSVIHPVEDNPWSVVGFGVVLVLLFVGYLYWKRRTQNKKRSAKRVKQHHKGSFLETLGK